MSVPSSLQRSPGLHKSWHTAFGGVLQMAVQVVLLAQAAVFFYVVLRQPALSGSVQQELREALQEVVQLKRQLAALQGGR